MSIVFEAHHGTSSEIARRIMASNYIPSTGDNHWLGDGTYFFVDGIESNTLSLAEKWAKAESWDNISKTHRYSHYGVLWSEIKVNEDCILDLTTHDGVTVFQYLMVKYEKKIQEIGKKLDYIDGYLINLARNEGVIPLEIAKGNFYIKFTRERYLKLQSRINNCTICVVFDPPANIIKTQIAKIENVL